MNRKARIVFTLVGIITLAALVIPTLIPCNHDRSQCMMEKMDQAKNSDCSIDLFECK